MLFFKPKLKHEELLPPPPPEGFEEPEKPELFEEVTKLKTDKPLEKEEFGELMQELEEKPKKETKAKAILKKSKKREINIRPKKAKAIKKQKEKKILPLKPKQEKAFLLKPKIKEPKIKPKPAKAKLKPKTAKKAAKKLISQKQKKATAAKPVRIAKKQGEIEFPELDEDFGKEVDIGFELPKEMGQKEAELPEELEEVLGADFEKELQSKHKPELVEAQEEIKSAIENIKERESSFKGLFAKKEKLKEADERFMPELAEEMQELPEDEISIIRENITQAREALMRFDLRAAKIGYIEAMKVYNSLSPEQQAKVYHDIKDLYSERKSAEELKL